MSKQSYTKATPAELQEQFNEGRKTTAEIYSDGIPFDYTPKDIRNKIKISRIFKTEKNPVIAYWLGRLRGLGDIRKNKKEQKESFEDSLFE